MINQDLFRRVADQIRRFPEQYDQRIWIDGRYTHNGCIPHNLEEIAEDSCGTSCCIAGWAVILHPDKNHVETIAKEKDRDFGATAAVLLGVDGYSLFDEDFHRLYLKRSKPEVDWDQFMGDAHYNVEYNDDYHTSYTPADYTYNDDEYDENENIDAAPTTVAAYLEMVANTAEFHSHKDAELALRAGWAREWMRNYELNVLRGAVPDDDYEPTGGYC